MDPQQTAFEQWMASSNYPKIAEVALAKLPDGNYKSQNTYAAWQGWQGALRQSWRPIDTAPKDGSWLLGWAGRDSAPYRISWGTNHDGRLAWCTTFASFHDGYITHWMPLTELPEQPVT